MYKKYLLFISALILLIDDSHSLVYKVFEWSHVNYTWPSSNNYNEALNSRSYVKENITITSVRPWKDRVFLTLPRLKRGVPATLAFALMTTSDSSPLLHPYPSWETQILDDCGKSLQSVSAIDIDSRDRLWVVDEGSKFTLMDTPNYYCGSSKLIIYDLNKNKTIIEYAFGYNLRTSDIVVDKDDENYAYISDSNPLNPSIVVFSLKEKKSWRLSYSLPKKDQIVKYFNVNDKRVETFNGKNSIALSPSSKKYGRFLYYAPTTSYYVYKISTKALKENKNDNSNVQLVGRVPSILGGLAIANNGDIYFGLLEQNTIWVYNASLSNSFEVDQYSYYKDPDSFQWPTSLSMDRNGYLWFLSNRYQNFINGPVNTTEKNFRIFYSQVNQNNKPNSASTIQIQLISLITLLIAIFLR